VTRAGVSVVGDSHFWTAQCNDLSAALMSFSFTGIQGALMVLTEARLGLAWTAMRVRQSD
jgi:hypothetical protein